MKTRKMPVAILLFLAYGAFAQEVEAEQTKKIEQVTISKRKKDQKKVVLQEILRRMVAQKEKNNPENIDSYSTENHTRLEVGIDELGQRFQEAELYKDLEKIQKKHHKRLKKGGILPLFVSENISDYYYQKNPEKTAEIIKKSRVEGVGIEDEKLFSQLISSTFINYNFYNDQIRIAGKDFVSPLADDFVQRYDFVLIDERFEDAGKRYYQVAFRPKNEFDLAFVGTMLIDAENYSLYQIRAKTNASANLNFIKTLRIEQQMKQVTQDGVYMPHKTMITLETESLGKEGATGTARFFSSSEKIRINPSIRSDVFINPMVVLPSALQKDEEYWKKNRHTHLIPAQDGMYEMVNEVKSLSSLQFYVNVGKRITTGYQDLGKLDYGPILHTIGYNDVEGFKMRVGGRTNHKFSERWILGGYVGYGFKDKEFKYGGNIDYIISKQPLMQTGISATHDLSQVAFSYGNYPLTRTILTDVFSRVGKISHRRIFWQNEYQGYFKMNISPSLTQKITLKHSSFSPLFDFSYMMDDGQQRNKFKTSEFIWETQWQPKKKNLFSKKNKSFSAVSEPFMPTVVFRYTKGFKGIFDSDFNYHKFHLNIRQKFPMGILGSGEYSITAGYIPDRVPYPLFENHLGNRFILYNKEAFNTMRFFEFTSNKFASLQYTQNLEGLITNRIPLIKKWNWRNHLTFNYLLGDLQDKFYDESIGDLDGKPYVELGYGISNIFRFLRVDFTHRLTHLDNQQPRFDKKLPKFNVKISANISL